PRPPAAANGSVVRLLRLRLLRDAPAERIRLVVPGPVLGLEGRRVLGTLRATCTRGRDMRRRRDCLRRRRRDRRRNRRVARRGCLQRDALAEGVLLIAIRAVELRERLAAVTRGEARVVLLGTALLFCARRGRV